MGMLALAGAVSGMGQAIGQGLGKYQDYIMASALQKERIEGENLRQSRVNEFTAGQNTLSRDQTKELAQMQRDTTLETNRVSADTALKQTGMSTNATIESAQIHKEGVDATLKNAKETADLNAQVQREQIKATTEMKKAYIGMYSQTRAKLDPETKQQVDLLGKQASSFMEEAKELRSMASKELNPEKKSSYEDQANKATSNANTAFESAFKLAGVKVPKFAKTKTGLNLPDDLPPATSKVKAGGTPSEMTGRSIFDRITNADEEDPKVVSTRPFSVPDEP